MRIRTALILYVSLFGLQLSAVQPNAMALPFNTDMLEVQPGTDAVSRPKPPGSISLGSLQRQKPELTTSWVQKNPVDGNPRAIARGESLFRTNCSPCHGEFKEGKQVPSALLMKGIPSIDLTADPIPGKPDAHFFTYVFNGGPLMPRYGYKLSNDEIWEVISYVRQAQRTAKKN